jgi:hypothetical protein
MLRAERRAQKKVVRRSFKKMCQECEERRALYTVRVIRDRTGGMRIKKKGERRTRFEKGHDLCSKCRRSLKDHVYAGQRGRRNWSEWQGGNSW